MTRLLPVLFLVYGLWSIVYGPPVHSAEFTRTQLMMGDVPVTIKIQAPKSAKTRVFMTMEASFHRGKEIESRVSEFNPESETSLLNRLAGKKWVIVSQDLIKILTEAKKISEATGGAFDITFASQKSAVSWRQILLGKENQVMLETAGVKIGLGGIAKGYIIDEMSRVLRKNRFRHHLISAGGDLYASGKWEVAIRNPFGQKPSLALMILKNQSACTSGLYERGYHIVDPRTGRKVRRRGSVTVVAKSAMTADAYATGLFVIDDPNFRLQSWGKKFKYCVNST